MKASHDGVARKRRAATVTDSPSGSVWRWADGDVVARAVVGGLRDGLLRVGPRPPSQAEVLA